MLEAWCFQVVCPSYIRPSACPSVRSLKYTLSTCTWVHWSIWATVTVFRSVCLDRFPSISHRTYVRNGLKFCMLVYPDHLQNWLDLGHSLLIFLHLASPSLVKWVKFGVSGPFLKNAWREWPEMLYVDVSWSDPCFSVYAPLTLASPLLEKTQFEQWWPGSLLDPSKGAF